MTLAAEFCIYVVVGVWQAKTTEEGSGKEKYRNFSHGDKEEDF